MQYSKLDCCYVSITNMTKNHTNKDINNNTIEAEKIVPLYKRFGAELIGTFALVFAAAGSDVSDALALYTDPEHFES